MSSKSNEKILIGDFSSQCQLFAQNHINNQIKLTWEISKITPSWQENIPNQIVVYYNRDFKNIDVIACPLLFPYLIEVHGDYRTQVDFKINTKKEFTANYIVRFPVGRFRSTQEKPAIECDSEKKLQEEITNAKTIIGTMIKNQIQSYQTSKHTCPPKKTL